MRRLSLPLAVGVALLVAGASGEQAPAAGPYTIVKKAKVGGAGGFDYVFADAAGRRLYIPRSGQEARVTVFDLDTLEPVGEIPKVNARGAVVDPKSGHKTNQIYIIAAEYGAPATAPPAGGRAGRGPMVPDSLSILVIGK